MFIANNDFSMALAGSQLTVSMRTLPLVEKEENVCRLLGQTLCSHCVSHVKCTHAT